MIRELASVLAWRRFLARNGLPLTDLETFPQLSPEAQRKALADRLLAQIQYFGNRADALPEWKECTKMTADDLWRVWPDMPLITKAMVNSRFPATEIASRFQTHGKLSSSGGSTGEPTRFIHDPRMSKAVVTGNAYTRTHMGWRPGMATVAVWGSERDIGRAASTRKTRLHSLLLRDYLVDGYHLSEQTVDRVLDIIRRHAPVAMYGFTSMLEFIARSVLARGEMPPPGSVRTAWNGGEMLYSDQADVFEKAFGAPLLNRYGGRELSTIACQYERGGALVMLRPWLIVELIDDNGRPASPGQPGRVILTSTICRGTPFLRYEIGDVAVADPRSYSESGLDALAELHGRHAGIIRLPDGRTINNLYWNHLLKDYAEVRQFQVVVKSTGEIQVSLVGDGMSKTREAGLLASIDHLLKGIPLKLVWVNELPRTRDGKLIQVVREDATPAASSSYPPFC